MSIDSAPIETTISPPLTAYSTRTKAKLQSLLMPLASLKLTVCLFVMAIFIILVGTLAQVDKNMWEVMDVYFRSWVAWIELQVFFPRTWFPNLQSIPGGFFFPGGATIGLVMFLNLLSAHSLRFKVQARGRRLLAGLTVAGLGILATWLVIASGHDKDGFQDEPFFEEWANLWTVIKFSLAGLWFLCLYLLLTLSNWRKLERYSLQLTLVGLGALVGWLLYRGDTISLGDSSLRILWQLILGTFAGGVLLAGCLLLFKKRAGIVLLHGGIGLMMLGELLVSKYAVEERITIAEGQTVNYARDIRAVELAVVDASNEDYDDVVVMPKSLLTQKGRISDANLPFDVEVLEYMKNSSVRRATEGETTLATSGKGAEYVAEPVRGGSGTDSSGKVDEASAYVRLFRKDNREEIGTYLFSQCIFAPMSSAVAFDEDIKLDDKTYDVTLRFKHNYKPYSMHLVDVRKDDYVGTSTPRNYSSDIRLLDAERSVDREVRVWMNNPLRFAGETFYQSGYNVAMDGTEITDLQVVSNTGWMIPYVSCMLVAIGMLYHFTNSLTRFLRRREEMPVLSADDRSEQPATSRKRRKAKRRQDEVTGIESDSSDGSIGWALPLAVVILCGLWMVGRARVPSTPAGEMDLAAFGKLPVAFQGRVKPMDTLARNTLRVVSNRETFKDDASKKSRPAIRWLLDVITESPDTLKHPVFRIENLELLETLGLERRKRFRYALEEFMDRMGEFEAQAMKAHEVQQKSPEAMSVFQRKVLELDRRIRAYTLLRAAFRHVPIPPFPSKEQFDKDPDAATEVLMTIKGQIEKVPQADQLLDKYQPPLVVPNTTEEDEPWIAYAKAWHRGYMQNIRGEQVNPATMAWQDILDSYRQDDAGRFNAAVASYDGLLQQQTPEECDLTKASFETFFSHFAPFYFCAFLYVIAFVIVAVSWLGWTRPLNRTALWMVAFTFLVHTFGLVARIYISGRAPVINLYSTAPFIGWGCVALGLLMEYVYRIGIGNTIACVGGFSSLVIAHFLSGDGDTITVLQAVLDTQFWLSTHVVTINFGYATTFVAGLLGIVYIIMGMFTTRLSPALNKDFGRMLYGALCFSIFFSFVGTVLGGLWADDSWGRFWGWDPKENGALIIVLWNALALHARWGKMVAQRGLAVLSVGGNIVTSWSWFGVNELGVGLHSYGFTEGVLLALGVFWASQLGLIALGMIPLSLWRSFNAPGNAVLARPAVE